MLTREKASTGDLWIYIKYQEERYKLQRNREENPKGFPYDLRYDEEEFDSEPFIILTQTKRKINHPKV